MKIYVSLAAPDRKFSHADQHDLAYDMLHRALRQENSAYRIEGAYTILHEDKGKPYIEGRADIQFNVSHCHEAAVLALSHYPVGIDVQGAFPWKEKLARRICSPSEWQLLDRQQSTEDKRQLLHRLWCRKEAVLKCLGIGISVDLRGVDCLVHADVLSYGGQNMRFAEYEIGTVKLCVCEMVS